MYDKIHYNKKKKTINHIVCNISFSNSSFIHILGNIYTEDIWN